jgi:hypothetical protein
MGATNYHLQTSTVKSCPNSDHCTSLGRLEVHLVGGFSDDRQLSQKLTHQLLSKFTPTTVTNCQDALLKQELMNS